MECARALKAITARAGTFGLKPAILENKVVYVDMNDCPAQLDILHTWMWSRLAMAGV